ncbi:hypothetical protein ACFY0A_32680 [Streptomyces sp. NPDC001698]|uniref:hypothetical protein n=1 Tax=unclassified Streptomyces TaxID=2593676 RepID=UPI0036B2E97E
MSVHNANGLSKAVNARITLQASAGLTLTATSPTTITGLPPGASAKVTYRAAYDVTNPPHSVLAPLSAQAYITQTGGRGVQTAAANLLVGPAPATPWRTFSATGAGAEFVQTGSGTKTSTGIDTSGADMWGRTQQFGTAYQQGVMSPGTSVTVRVTTQISEGGRPWARSGIVVSTDLSKAQSPGTIALALTPAEGCVLTWS